MQFILERTQKQEIGFLLILVKSQTIHKSTFLQLKYNRNFHCHKLVSCSCHVSFTYVYLILEKKIFSLIYYFPATVVIFMLAKEYQYPRLS